MKIFFVSDVFRLPVSGARLGAIFLSLLLLGGCAPAAVTLSPWQEEAITMGFIASLEEKKDLPLQGGVEVNEQGGRMAVVTQHGRTLGQCTWTYDAVLDPAASGALYCEASQGFGVSVQGLVQDVAVAVYSALQSHAQGTNAVPADNTFIHSGNSGNIEIQFIGGQ